MSTADSIQDSLGTATLLLHLGLLGLRPLTSPSLSLSLTLTQRTLTRTCTRIRTRTQPTITTTPSHITSTTLLLTTTILPLLLTLTTTRTIRLPTLTPRAVDGLGPTPQCLRVSLPRSSPPSPTLRLATPPRVYLYLHRRDLRRTFNTVQTASTSSHAT